MKAARPLKAQTLDLVHCLPHATGQSKSQDNSASGNRETDKRNGERSCELLLPCVFIYRISCGRGSDD